MNDVATLSPVEIALRDANLNRIEAVLAKFPQVDLPLHHVFTPGLYVRECMIPANTLCTTKIHKTQHPFVISKGIVYVRTIDTGWERYEAPFTGVTKPGTRRLIYAPTDVIWSTFHVTPETDLAKIEAQLIEPHDIPFPKAAQHLEELKEIMACTP